MVKKKNEKRTKESFEFRPPVVAVLGHIDHGKTTLLDYIRKSRLTSEEHGGITQHIGAYQIKLNPLPGEAKIKSITFIDTPGHEAFAKMRSRGASVADLAVLVVAADDGIKPQTMESFNHIKAARIPFLVAINKIDLVDKIQIEKVKKQLAKRGILLEGFGGDIVSVPISAVKGTGIPELLEMIMLLAEMHALKVSPAADFEGVIIESKTDNRRGPQATVIVKKGKLKITDEIQVSDFLQKVQFCKVRTMIDENGHHLKTAGPGSPIVVLGWKKLPQVGEILHQKSLRKKEQKEPEIFSEEKKEMFVSRLDKTPKIKIILKADTLGTLEAILASLPENIAVISSGVGEIRESDIFLAGSSSSSKAIIIGFNVSLPKNLAALARREKIIVKTYNIIYRLLEEIQEAAEDIFEPEEELLGEAQILAEFPYDKKRVAGCKITLGRLVKNEKVKIFRQEEEIGQAKIVSLRVKKEEVNKVKENEECGILLNPQIDFELGDIIKVFK